MYFDHHARAVPLGGLVILAGALALANRAASDGGRHTIGRALSFVGRRSSCQYPADQAEKESDADFTF
jgi:hypothetical protein